MVENKNSNKRNHIRFLDLDRSVVDIILPLSNGEECLQKGLLIDESLSGMSLVYIGEPLDLNKQVIWQESKYIQTPCEVIRCHQLDAKVFSLALRRKG